MTGARRPCVVVETFHPEVGGGEVQARALVERLAARGRRPLVLTLRSRPDLPRGEDAGGYDVVRVGSGRNRWRGILAIAAGLRRLRPEYDLIFVSGLRALGIPAAAAARRARVPLVLESQNNGELSGSYFDPGLRRFGVDHRSPGLRRLDGWRRSRLVRADGFVAVSSSIEREYLACGVAASRIRLIPYGVDLDRFRPPRPGERDAVRDRLGVPRDALVVCFLGRLVAWKGPLTLLESWRELSPTLAAGRRRPLLVLAGAGGADRHNCEAEARAFCRRHDLERSVRFTGDVRNAEEWLRVADACAFPTEDDLFGTVAVEAMASGLPLVTTRVAGLADYVRDGENALAVEPRDVAGLTAALRRLLGDPALGRRLAAGGIATAAGLGIDRTADARLDLFDELTASRGQAA